jgi:ribosomal protein S18 acetylase RimI-like enzyme
MIEIMTKEHFVQFWPVFSEVISAQETYAFDPDMTLEQAYNLWCERALHTFAYIEDGMVIGSYYLKANAAGPGKHVCNCGYIVNPLARGKGIARLMCEHSQTEAARSGFRAMQFNSVVATNKVAVALWQKLGFNIIGTIPKGYRHREQGFVDCFIMHKSLVDE